MMAGIKVSGVETLSCLRTGRGCCTCQQVASRPGDVCEKDAALSVVSEVPDVSGARIGSGRAPMRPSSPTADVKSNLAHLWAREQIAAVLHPSASSLPCPRAQADRHARHAATADYDRCGRTRQHCQQPQPHPNGASRSLPCSCAGSRIVSRRVNARLNTRIEGYRCSPKADYACIESEEGRECEGNDETAWL